MLKKLFEFKNFEKNFRFFAPFSFGCFVVFLLLAIPAIINSPFDYQQGNAVKIMYIHVPAAWMALLVYTLMAIFNLSGFIWKNPFFYLIAKSIALIGCAFTFITLATGSLWGKPIWGVWWVWDARLTSVLILLFLYLGYMILLDSFADNQIFGGILEFSASTIKHHARWWNCDSSNYAHTFIANVWRLFFLICFSLSAARA